MSLHVSVQIMYRLWKVSCDKGAGWGYGFENGRLRSMQFSSLSWSIVDSYDSAVS